MIVNLWSTPRTGSNWYSQYLHKKYLENNKRTILYHQYLNEYHMKGYSLIGSKDYVYNYINGSSYTDYYFDYLKKAINYRAIFGPRKLELKDENLHRLELLDKHDFVKNPSIFYNHIQPIDKSAFTKLFDMADKNIFLYRKDIKRQLASYALGYGTNTYKPTKNGSSESNIHVDYHVLENLATRIIYWYQFDKKDCKVVAYEDLDFDKFSDLPKKQNITDPFLRLSEDTKNSILTLVEKIRQNV